MFDILNESAFMRIVCRHFYTNTCSRNKRDALLRCNCMRCCGQWLLLFHSGSLDSFVLSANEWWFSVCLSVCLSLAFGMRVRMCVCVCCVLGYYIFFLSIFFPFSSLFSHFIYFWCMQVAFLMHFHFYYWFLDSWALSSRTLNTNHSKDNDCKYTRARTHTFLQNRTAQTLHANSKCENPIFTLLRWSDVDLAHSCDMLCLCLWRFFPLHLQMFHYVHASLLLIQTYAFPSAVLLSELLFSNVLFN